LLLDENQVKGVVKGKRIFPLKDASFIVRRGRQSRVLGTPCGGNFVAPMEDGFNPTSSVV